jgi:galactokinase
MTGAGFGGCTVNLIEKNYIDTFKKSIKNEHKKITGINPDIYVTHPAEGAKVIELSQ